MANRPIELARADFRRLVGPRALHPVVLFPGLVLLTLGTAFADTQNLTAYNEAWVVVAVQGFMAACLTFFAFGAPVRFAKGIWRTTGVLVTYASTEFARTFVVESAALSRGLIDEVNWFTQGTTAILTGMTIYGVASLTVNNAYQFRTTVADLTARS